LALILTDFRSLQPKHLTAQALTLEWLAAAHTRAELTLARAEGRDFAADRFAEQMVRRLARFGCGAESIASRGHQLDDCAHTRWSDMQIYRLAHSAQGEGALSRTRLFNELASDALEQLYAECKIPPDDLVHVTCTGYASPSAAQRLISSRGWGRQTRAVHAYHMGCYAAFPALRMAGSFVEARPLASSRRSEVVHTEICSLHFNPLSHTPEQLVVQSLFADGFIAYGVLDESTWDQRSPAFLLLAQDERIVPDSSNAMSWICSDWGMLMSLARDVPERIEQQLREFVSGLAEHAGLSDAERRGALYAIHPGGPRILERAQSVLELSDAQLTFSRGVLRERGNMSSATLPHIWQEILRSERVESGRAIFSLAFGPGLTLCGAVLRKRVA
jgi:predicted naringenin-chalcone synthase